MFTEAFITMCALIWMALLFTVSVPLWLHSWYVEWKRRRAHRDHVHVGIGPRVERGQAFVVDAAEFERAAARRATTRGQHR